MLGKRDSEIAAVVKDKEFVSDENMTDLRMLLAYEKPPLVAPAGCICCTE